MAEILTEEEIDALLSGTKENSCCGCGCNKQALSQKEIESFSKTIEFLKNNKTKAVKAMDRNDILDTAKKIINGDRKDQYGDAEDAFGLISEYWSAYTRQKLKNFAKKMGMYTTEISFFIEEFKLESHDSAYMLSLFKMAREQHKHKADNAIDGINYFALGAEIEERRNAPNNDSKNAES